MTVSSQGHLAIFISFSGQGGVERMVLNLLPAFADSGVTVDLLTLRADPALERELPLGIRHRPLKVRHSLLAVPALVNYLRRERPTAFLAVKDRAIRSAALACRLAHSDTRLVGRLGTHLSTALAEQHPLNRLLRQWPMRWLYPRVDRIVAVSQGVADDTVATSGLSADRIVVIRNPVITPRLTELALEPVDHRWFNEDGPPVVLGVGRLTRQKDFLTLIRAVAEVRRVRRVRLMILGEGRDRAELDDLAIELGFGADFELPGFVANPYAYMARASVFALSSAWEGSPNVLTEAMALGTPVVATDCPSGPDEILAGGRYGPLVPVGDVQAFADALLDTLSSPLSSELLQSAVEAYRLETSATAYLTTLGLVTPRSRSALSL